MKAITVKPVWAWAIIYAGKNIENRSWQLISAALSLYTLPKT